MLAYAVTMALLVAAQPEAGTPPLAVDYAVPAESANASSDAGHADAPPPDIEPDTADAPPAGEEAAIPGDIEPEGEQPVSAEDQPFGPEPRFPSPRWPGAAPERDTPAPDVSMEYPCEFLQFLWTGPYAGDPRVENGADRPRSMEEAAVIYADYFRFLFLSVEDAGPCEVRQDPLITLANTMAAVARGHEPAAHLMGLLARSRESAQAVWMLDAVVRHDRAHTQSWQQYFGPGPSFRVIDLAFDTLPRGGMQSYQALLHLTESAQGVHANYIASRFVAVFANQPQWVLINAERFIPFGPALRVIFCTYLSVPEREALALRYAEFPYSDAQVAIVELIACL